MGAKIIIGLVIGVLSSYILDKYKGRKASKVMEAEDSSKPTKPRWILILISVIPGFFLGAVFAVILEKMEMAGNIEAFSTGFYILISLGSIISYLILNKFFPQK